MVFDPENPNSLLNCLTRARENARGIRENISAEMWECLNTLYWSIRGDDAAARFEESPDDFYRQVMIGSMLFQGLTDQTLAHDQRWLFTQLGKYLERVDVTCRVIETKFGILRSADDLLAGAMRNIHWMAVLRSCCSIEAYRRQHVGRHGPAARGVVPDPGARLSRGASASAWSRRTTRSPPSAPRSTRWRSTPPSASWAGSNAQLEYAEIERDPGRGPPRVPDHDPDHVAEAGARGAEGVFPALTQSGDRLRPAIRFRSGPGR